MSLRSRVVEGLKAWLLRHRVIAFVAFGCWLMGFYMGWGNSCDHRSVVQKTPPPVVARETVRPRRPAPVLHLDRLYEQETRLVISKASKKLAEVETSLVERRLAYLRLSMSGRVAFAPTHIRLVTSPARGKVRLLRFSGEQVRASAALAKVQGRTVTAPLGGLVAKTFVASGAVVKAGTPLFSLVDLSNVQVNFTLPVEHLPRLSIGQTIAFSPLVSERNYAGTVVAIGASTNPGTQRVPVTVRAPNPQGLLRAGMLVQGEVRAAFYVGEAKQKKNPLLIPSTALLYRGQRSMVYVRVPGAAKPTYEGRVVQLGPRVGSFFVILRGLKAGDRVVSRGAFKIDSELQIRTSRSMMTKQSASPTRKK